MMDILRKFLIYILLPSLISIAVGLALTHKLYPYIALILIIAIISTFIIILNLEWKLRKKLRHFEILRKKSFTIDDNMNFYKGSSPRQEDIGSDRDVIRELHYKLFPQILETKNSQKNSYLSIIAPPQEGKSTLLLRFVKELLDRKEIVLWADATYKFAQENPFDELKLIRKWRKKRLFAIIDNIARLQRYEDFLDNLARHPEVKVTMIGASRIEDWEKVKFEHPSGIEYLFENPDSKPPIPFKLDTTDADIMAAAQKLLDKGVLKELKKPLRVPPNFSILIWALAAPEGEENFSQRMLEEADSLSPLEKKAYLYICALHRFGLPFPETFINRLLNKNVTGNIQRLVEKGVIFHIDKIDSYISRHEVVAESIFSHFCALIRDYQPLDLYKNILYKTSFREEMITVLLFEYLEKDLSAKLKNDLVHKYKKTFSKSRSAELLGLGWGPIFRDISCKDLAEEVYRKSLAINDKFLAAHFNYANLLDEIERYGEAEEHYKRALELNDNFPETHNNYALLLVEQERYYEAEEHYKKALKLEVDNPLTHSNYAILLAKMERYNKAEQHYIRALELEEDEAEAHFGYAHLLAMHDRYIEAELHYRRALELKEDYPEAHNNYAFFLTFLKRYSEAESHYLRALELKDDLVAAMLNLGSLYIKLKKHDKASYWLKKTMEYRDRLPDKGKKVKEALKALSTEKGQKKEEKPPENEL